MKNSHPNRPHSEALEISVVTPLYNEVASLEELYRRLVAALGEITDTYEILFVDDGSTDGSIDKIKEICSADSHGRYLRFRRNFGKSAALAAGFQAARYEVIVTIDADLQDLPEELPLLVARLAEGFDLVSGWRHQRQDTASKRFGSLIYNRVTSFLTGVRLHDLNCGFKCYRRDVLKEVKVYGERHRYIPVLASYRGFRLSEVKIRHAPRAYGRSRYGLGRVFGGMFSLLTVILMTRYTNKPLHFFGFLGISLAALGTVIDLYLFALRLFFKEWLSNRPLLIIGTLLIIVGVQLILFGLLAEMIAFSYRRESDYSIVETSDEQGRADAAADERLKVARRNVAK
jgi:glycosyltransferase involved in cell wall biosynthesis